MKNICITLAFACLIVACTPRGLRSPGPSPEDDYTSKSKPTKDQVITAMKECGYYQIDFIKREEESIDNARARFEECMFARGFYLQSGWGGICASPNYRNILSVCKNVPIRSRWNYYGEEK